MLVFVNKEYLSQTLKMMLPVRFGVQNGKVNTEQV